MHDRKHNVNTSEHGVESNALRYRHSDPASMDTETEWKYLSRFQPRVSKYISTSHDACIECHIDLFGKSEIGKVIGGMNAHMGDFAALCAPEALPERIGLCSYFIEYAFVHDDVLVDAIQTPDVQGAQKNELLDKAAGTKQVEVLAGINNGSLRRKQVRAKIWSVLNELDSEYLGRCRTTFRQWFETARQMRDRTFTNLDDYLATRALDCGANWVVRMMGWASGVELTPEEDVEIGPVTYLAFVVLGITNDIWSWEREKRATQQSEGGCPLINAVQLVMQMHHTDEEAAKQMVCNMIRGHEEQYCRLRDEYLQRPKISLAVKKWFQILELSMAGNALWSVHAIRYHQDVQNPYRGPFDCSSVFKNLTMTQSRTGVRKEGHVLNGYGRITRVTSPVYKSLDALDEAVLWKPYQYIISMPSKGFRKNLIDSLQTWYKVPHSSVQVISGVASLLHEASLMLDDIQDGSSLRRGKPAVHEIFGVSQTINSAGFHINNALRLVQQLSPSAVLIFSDQMSELYTGQAHDIFWANHKFIPTEEDYYRMIDGKTSGLFVLLARLMRNEATKNRDLDLCYCMKQIGRYYQIRDDYQNLVCPDYVSQRGFCQDLDEGKISFPLIRAYRTLEDSTILNEWLNMRGQGVGLSVEVKRYIFGQIEDSGSLEYTRALLDDLLLDLKLNRGPEKKESTLAHVLHVWGGYQEAAWRSELN
ncbi:polyprenyl synthetase [Aspergillus cavernicola]|uniref:Polyprenyl synthetase n=1 Tax=Aspergillus cavernicola TaxID=176166 RepID=A0ABR4IAA8_9EURO